MKQVNRYLMECEAGHITADNEKQDKCQACTWQLYYEKGSRKKSWNGEYKKTDKKCGKPIIGCTEIPEELDYFDVWDHKKMHAFLIGQKFDAEFMIGLQTAFTRLLNEYKNLLRKYEDKIKR